MSRMSSTNFIPNPLLATDLPYDMSSPGGARPASSQGMSSSSATTDIPPMMREQTINKV